MMDTRCGAAMTLAMPCIIGMLFIYVFGASNILTIKTLLPELEIIEITHPSIAENNMFGNMTLQIETLAFAGALGQQTCNNIASISSGVSQLDCTTTSVTKSKPQEDIVLCSTNVICIVDNKITGNQNVLLKFPTAFQKFQWNVKPGKEWYNTQTEIYSVLVSQTKEIFSGTEIAPTELNFGIVRGKLSDNTTRKTIHSIVSADKTDFGLQLSWRGSNLQQSEEGPSTPFHYVDFKFAVSENVFNVELQDDKDLISLFTAVLTFFLSIMSAMRMLKTHGARGVDKALKIQSEKNGTGIPEDVLRRERILDEHLLTKNGGRRLSMSDGGDKSGQPPKQRRLSSREIIKQEEKKNTKKKRRLSSRELMNEEKEKAATTVDIGIEMTDLGAEHQDEMTKYTNPLKRHSIRTGRRHSSASLSPLRMTTASDGDGGVVKLKEKIKSLELKLEEQSRQTKFKLEEQSRQMEQIQKKMEEQSKQISLLLVE